MDQQTAEALRTVGEIVTASRVLLALLILAGTYAVNRLVGAAAVALARRFGRFRLQIVGMVPIVRLALWAIATYLILVDVFEPPQAQLLALLASVGLAVGLAAQDLIRNVIAGVIILSERPFRVGDMVKLGEHYGEITAIGLRSVQLQTFDDSAVTIPNSFVMNQPVVNSNSGELHEMVVVSFVVPAWLAVGELKALAWEAAACSPYVFLKKPIAVIIEDAFDRMFLTRVTVKAYVLDVRLERVFASDVIERIKDALLRRELIPAGFVVDGLVAPRPGEPATATRSGH